MVILTNFWRLNAGWPESEKLEATVLGHSPDFHEFYLLEPHPFLMVKSEENSPAGFGR